MRHLDDIQKLTDLELDVAIAKECGWIVRDADLPDWVPVWVTESRDAIHRLAYALVTDFPDGVAQWYLDYLQHIGLGGWTHAIDRIAWATPRQMCEAYLLTRQRYNERN